MVLHEAELSHAHDSGLYHFFSKVKPNQPDKLNCQFILSTWLFNLFKYQKDVYVTHSPVTVLVVTFG